MIDAVLLDFLREWGVAGFLVVGIVSLWRKNESQERRLAEVMMAQINVIKDNIRHTERSNLVLDRIERALEDLRKNGQA